jgi:hypothetical protein
MATPAPRTALPSTRVVVNRAPGTAWDRICIQELSLHAQCRVQPDAALRQHRALI